MPSCVQAQGLTETSATEAAIALIVIAYRKGGKLLLTSIGAIGMQGV